MPGIIVTYTERQIQHMSVPEGTLHSSTGLAMPWERHHDEALAALTRPTLVVSQLEGHHSYSCCNHNH